LDTLLPYGNPRFPANDLRLNYFARAVLRRRAEFLQAMRGVSPHRAARLLGKANVGGVDWTGCSKATMADSFAEGDHDLWKVTAEQLVKIRKELYGE